MEMILSGMVVALGRATSFLHEVLQFQLNNIIYTVADGCISTVYVMGFTSGIVTAESDHRPYLQISLQNNEEGTVIFPDVPGDDMVQNKGDLWEINLSSFGFSMTCITKRDGWNIQSIATMICSGSKFQILTADMNVNRWIDGDDQPFKRSYSLRKQN